MNRLAIVLVSFGLFVSPRLFSQQMPTWELARDSQIPFTQGADGVWYFMESEARVHDPSRYRLLTRFLVPCKNETLVRVTFSWKIDSSLTYLMCQL
jgi:hypothetical protein